MDSFKTWLVEVALKKVGPTAMASGISALLALLAAHQGLLQQWGITVGDFSSFASFHPTGQCILIELDTVSTAALAGLGTLIVAIMAATQHHAVATVTGAPQSGDMRKIDVPVVEPTRKDDPPKAVLP